MHVPWLELSQRSASSTQPPRLHVYSLGYEKVKDHQLQVVTGILKGHDVFAVLPTGYGKSLCFASLPMLFDQVLPLKEPSIVIVVSTLTAKLRFTYVRICCART